MPIGCHELCISRDGQVAQLVEQRTENPCVGGSIPSLATIINASTEDAQFARLSLCAHAPRKPAYRDDHNRNSIETRSKDFTRLLISASPA